MVHIRTNTIANYQFTYIAVKCINQSAIEGQSVDTIVCLSGKSLLPFQTFGPRTGHAAVLDRLLSCLAHTARLAS